MPGSTTRQHRSDLRVARLSSCWASTWTCLRSLSDEAIISLLKRPDASADVASYWVAAELLREQGEIDEIRRGAGRGGYDCRLKSAERYTLRSLTQLQPRRRAARTAPPAGSSTSSLATTSPTTYLPEPTATQARARIAERSAVILHGKAENHDAFNPRRSGDAAGCPWICRTAVHAGI